MPRIRVRCEEDKHHCDFEGCDYSTNMANNFRRHQLTHNNKEPAYFCEFEACDFSTLYKNAFEEHVKTHDGYKGFLCPYEKCEFATTAATNLRAHIRKIHKAKEDEFVCDFLGCEKAFKNKEYLTKHKKTHETERYECSYEGCDFATTRKEYIDEHVQRVHVNIGPFYCDVPECTFETMSKQAYGYHIRAHKKYANVIYKQDRGWICQVEGCDMYFSQANALMIHVNIHNNIRPYKCDFEGCDAAFREVGALNMHRKIHLEIRDFPCKVDGCNYKGRSSSQLKVHMQTHSDERPFVCQMEGCTSAFKQKRLLDIHMNVHQDIRPYLCPVDSCEFAARQLAHLNSHIFTHEDYKNRPFACEFEGCGFRTVTTSSLTIHQRKHTKEKPYVCTFDGCDYACSTATNIAIHKLRHMNIRPHKCQEDACGYAAFTTGDLKLHMKNIHSDESLANQKRDEMKIERVLSKNNINYKREHVIDFRCISRDTSYARIDFVIEKGPGIIFLEVDENQHKYGDYGVGCDMARMSKIVESLAVGGNTLPILFVRYNPRVYKVGGEKQKMLVGDREDHLIRFINEYEFVRPLEIQYMFYDCDDNKKLMIHKDPTYSEFIKECCLDPII